MRFILWGTDLSSQSFRICYAGYTAKIFRVSYCLFFAAISTKIMAFDELFLALKKGPARFAIAIDLGLFKNYALFPFLCLTTYSIKNAKKMVINRPTTNAISTFFLLFGLMG
jgi:hypothetical protein